MDSAGHLMNEYRCVEEFNDSSVKTVPNGHSVYPLGQAAISFGKKERKMIGKNQEKVVKKAKKC